jgi:hypothetical protein
MAECAKAAGLDGMAKVCSDRAEHYRVMHDDATSKSIADEIAKSRNELQPTNVSVVAPTPPGVTAVPRAGQKSIEAKLNPVFAEIYQDQVGTNE